MLGLSRAKLTDRELAEELARLPGWSVVDGMLARSFEFPTYKDGLAFATAVGWEADRLDHHPDLTIGYRKVRVATCTHDAGGLTLWDVELAKRVDRLT